MKPKALIIPVDTLMEFKNCSTKEDTEKLIDALLQGREKIVKGDSTSIYNSIEEIYS